MSTKKPRVKRPGHHSAAKILDAPKYQDPGLPPALHLDLTADEWGRAMGLARKGETWLLCELLMDLTAEIPPAVRTYLAGVCAASRRRRGLPGRLTSNDLEWIRFSAGLECAVNPEYHGHLGRARLVKDFAKQYKVSESTMREVMAGKRRRYARSNKGN